MLQIGGLKDSRSLSKSVDLDSAAKFEVGGSGEAPLDMTVDSFKKEAFEN